MNQCFGQVLGWMSKVAGNALAALLLAACASGPMQTAGQDPKNGDGIGGTGILGTISGFGSIIVNGMVLEYDRGTKVEVDGRPAALEDLKVGQIILGTARTKNGELYLDSIEMLHAVTGPIDAIDHDAQSMTILGQRIRLNLGGDGAAIESFKTLGKGDAVSISGLRMADGTIVATRVDQRPDDGRLIVRGIAGALTGNSVTIGGLDIPLDQQSIVSPVKQGGRLFVSGRMIEGKFSPDVVIGSPALPFEAGVKDVSLEAYVPGAPGQALMIDGVTVDGAALPAGTAVGDRIIVTGSVNGADRIAAAAISKIKTVVTILRARGSMRPAAVRPGETTQPERLQPPSRPTAPPDRPEREQLQRERPQIERPADFSVPMV